MTRIVRVGFIPLMDAALLLVAAREGFAEEEGLALDLLRDVSWANLRDKLALGFIDAAHMLAPAAVAASLGIGQIRVPLLAPMALNLNGNAITVSLALHDVLAAEATGDLADPVASATALRRVVGTRRAGGAPPPTFGHVFPFSSHHYQLRAWMRAGGVDPDRDVNLVVLPPPYMARSLASGLIDGFCVGAPWNSLAVAEGHGRILHTGTDIVEPCVEKVLAVRAGLDAEAPDTVERLVRAVAAAASWAAEPGNLDRLAAVLAGQDAVGVPQPMARAILTGEFRTGTGLRVGPQYLRLTPDALPPWPDHADWILRHMIQAGQLPGGADGCAEARAVFGLERYRRATGEPLQVDPTPPGGIGA
ncbi:MAG: CmpA/NrtA family ABC transporter substrate-binding protein [Alsobacter sp.]